jgi:undecaprenyl-diphosphatase
VSTTATSKPKPTPKPRPRPRPKTHGPDLHGRLEHWRHHTFGPASEEPYRRRTSDWVRLVVAVIVIALLIAHEGDLSKAEQNLFTFFNTLPDDLNSLFTLLYRVGALWAVGIVVVAALIARRWHLARDLAIAGALAWFVSRLIGVLVVNEAGLTKSLDIVTRFGDDTAIFPVVRLAVIVAVIATATPYLTRPVRRLGQLLIISMALAAMYLGTGLPDGILAAMFLGWGVAALIHLVFGSPGGRPTRAQVAAALAELGVPAQGVELAPLQPTGATCMVARDHEGPLAVQVLGRDEADAQFIAKVTRGLVYKDGGPTMHLTRLEDVEHEAYTLLLASRAGARVPDVVAAGTAGPGAALLVTRAVEGTLLCEAEPRTVNNRTLDALWKQAAALRAAHVNHGRLNAQHIVLTASGPAITDFAEASGAASEDREAADLAELLVSTSAIVGNDRAIAAAIKGVGKDAVIAALPMLQPGALSSDLRPSRRRAKKEAKQQIAALREAAAAATGTEEPPLQQLYRVSGTNLMMAVGSLIAIAALLGQVGDPQELWDTVTNADLGWLIVATLVSFATNIATAIALMGTVPIRLPLWRTAELQLSMSFSNLAVPAIGGLAAQIRFLQMQGADLASAVASGGILMNAGNIVVQILMFIVALALSPVSIDTGKIPVSSIESFILIAVVVGVLALALILGIPRLRRAVAAPVKSAWDTIWVAVRSPRQLVLLLGGNAINALMYAFVLLACIEAFGGSLNFWTVLAINIFVSTIASLVPIPGGNTAVSAVGLSGALAAAGVPTDVAVAAVLTDQLVANFLPAIPGWIATKNMLDDGYL